MSENSSNSIDSDPQSSASWTRIPAELKARRQWAFCASGPNKRPLTANGTAASSTDPETWIDFDTACRIARERNWQIGFMLREDDPLCCIDLDVKTHTSEADLARFNSIIEAFDSYTEHSRSGLGWHIWLEGAIGRGRKRDGVEVYSQERFIICTGDVVRDKPIQKRQALLTGMVNQMAPAIPAAIELWGDNSPDWSAANQAAADTGEMGLLFAGNWQGRYPSQSEADLALVKKLMPLTESPQECWSTFRLSKLGKRDKAARDDYARSTLALAALHLATDANHAQLGEEISETFFSGNSSKPPSPYFKLLRDAELDELPPLRWLVKRVLPSAGIGTIYGESGTYKSFLTLDLLAHVSNGQEWFGNRVKAAPAVYVPFEGQGGIPNRIKAWRLAETVRRNPDLLFALEPDADVTSGIAVVMEPLNLRDKADRGKLVATIVANGLDGGILCIDTLAHASAGLDENSSAMAEILSAILDMQRQLGGVILLVHHSGKDPSRGMRGWSGLHAAMDFVIECQRDKDGSSHSAEFVLTKVKDGTTGARTTFQLQVVQIGIDEDGDNVSSLVVLPTQSDQAIERDDPFYTDANDNDDDQFVWDWVKREVELGAYPSGRSLEGQRANQMSGERRLTQARLRDAIHRLRATSKLVNAEQKAPSGNVYMVAQ